MIRYLLSLIASLALVSAAKGATTVGAEALLTLPTSGHHRLFIGNSPADGEQVQFNPPIFKWIYSPDPWTMGFPEKTVRSFVFQLSTNTSFASPYWSITTSNNFENFLQPITNANGSAWAGTNYWRIIYMNSNATVNVATSDVHHFTFSNNVATWDRARFASVDYLNSITTNHPHMMFAVTNRDAIITFMKTNGQFGWDWLQKSNIAIETLGSNWWNNASVYTNLSRDLQAVTMDQIIYVCLFHQLLTNSIMTASNPGSMVDLAATMWVRHDQDRRDVNSNSKIAKYLPLLYDWAYDDMTSLQRSNVLWVMERQVLWSHHEQFWHAADNNGVIYDNTNSYRPYTNNLVLNYNSHGKAGGSHERSQLGVNVAICMAGMGESALLRELFKFYMNYMIAQFDPFAGDEGKGYNEQSFKLDQNFGSYLTATMVFREMGLTNVPWIRKYPKMFMHQEPLMYVENHDQFGDYGLNFFGNPPVPKTIIFDNKYYTLSLLLGDGVMYRHNRRAFQIRTDVDTYGIISGTFFFPYYNRTAPAEADGTENHYLDVLDGWAITATHAPNQWGAFTNGAGMVLTARPAGGRAEHGTWHDGAPQFYAYGAQVSSGGVGYTYKHPLFYPGLMVDGIGAATPNGQYPSASWYSRLIAFTNNSEFAYAAGEYGDAYNPTNFGTPGGNGNLITAYVNSTNLRPYVTSVQRHVVMVKGTNSDSTYWLDYSSMTTTQAALFQWHWPIMERTATTNLAAASFTFTSTNFYNGSNVTTVVQHIVDPSLITMTSLNGTNYMATNIHTRESLDISIVDGPRPESQIWVQNTTPATNFHHLVAIGPSKWGSNLFQFTRLDDYTVKVIRPDGVTETNTFGTNYAGAYTRRFELAESVAGSDPDPEPSAERRVLGGAGRVSGRATFR